MDKAVSASDANRKFSKLLRAVREGHSFVVTSHGKAVARIAPPGGDGGTARRARTALMARLRAQKVVNIGRWSRAELYQERS